MAGVVTARTATEVEMAVVRAEAEEAIVIAQAEVEKTVEDEFGADFF